MSENVLDIRTNRKASHNSYGKPKTATGSESLAEVKIQRDFFKEYSLLLLLAIAMTQLNYLLRKWKEGYKFTK